MRSALNVRPFAAALLDLMGQIVAPRSDAVELLDRLAAGAVDLRIVIQNGIFALGVVDTDGSVSVLDALFIDPRNPDCGLTVDQWMRDQLDNLPKH